MRPHASRILLAGAAIVLCALLPSTAGRAQVPPPKDNPPVAAVPGVPAVPQGEPPPAPSTIKAPTAAEFAATHQYAASDRPAVNVSARTTLPPKPAQTKLDGVLLSLSAQAARGEPLAMPGVLGSRAGASLIAVSIAVDPANPGVAAQLGRIPGVLVVNRAPDVLEAYVPVAQLDPLTRVAGVWHVEAIIPPQADVVSQGAAVHNAPNWNSYGFTGAGVKVGIIDVGFNGYGSLVGTELPAPSGLHCYTSVGTYTSNLADCEVGSVHGAAVAETIIDVAPGVSIYLANPGSYADLLASAQWMVSEGVTVINHSVSWVWSSGGSGWSIYSDSPLRAVDVATSGGAVWVNAAGNYANSTWTGRFNDDDSDRWLEFSPLNEGNGVYLSAGQAAYFQLRWNDCWGCASDDIDLYLMDSGGGFLAASTAWQNGQPGQVPKEGIYFVAPASGWYYLGVYLFSGWEPGWLQLNAFYQNTLSVHSASYSIAEPADSWSGGMIAAGAARWDNTGQVESFSSQGPTIDGRTKPTLVGADGGNTVSYGGPFYGTSQAAPHIAGLAALVRQVYGWSPWNIVSQLQYWAQPGGLPDNQRGWGLAWLPGWYGRSVVQQAPTGGLVYEEFPVQPVIAMVDASFAVQTGNNSTLITLVLGNANGAILTCDGGLTRTVSAGVAAYTGCKVDKPGQYYLFGVPNCRCFIYASGWFDVFSYAVSWTPVDVPSTMVTDGHSFFRMTIKNLSGFTWMKAGPNPVVLSYNWYNGACGTGGSFASSGIDVTLPADVPPGGTVSKLNTSVRGPLSAGTYCLVYDMKHTGIRWFSEAGAATQQFTVTVANPVGPLYGANFTIIDTPTTMTAGATSYYGVNLENTGQFTWAKAYLYRTVFRIHWYAGACPGGAAVGVWAAGTLTVLPKNVLPGQTSGPFSVAVQAPAAPGTYCLEYDLHRTSIAFFSSKGVVTPRFTVTVN